MEPFARLVVGYHGCTEALPRELLLGRKPLREWQASTNDWDWLGHGIYFWEHAPQRALRWARERYRTRRQRPAVLGAYIQLGRCFDLLDESVTALLGEAYERLAQAAQREEIRCPRTEVVRGSCAISTAWSSTPALMSYIGGELITIRCGVPSSKARRSTLAPGSRARATSRLRCGIPLVSSASFSLTYK
jgi:hypothetical protein